MVIQAQPILPAGRMFAIGDTHGCYQTLFALLKKIKFTKKDCIYLLGDYCDRGPDTKRLVDLIMSLEKQHCAVALRGNHDQLLVNAALDPREEKHWRDVNGGNTTLESFGVKYARLLPKKYLTWFRQRPLTVKFEDDDGRTFVLSHAGINKQHDKPFRDTQTNAQHILWNRDKPVPHKRLINVVGHTSKSLAEIRKSLTTSTIYIDGGCGHGGNLVALDLDTLEITWVRNCDGL